MVSEVKLRHSPVCPRIVFFGTPEFSFTCLEYLIDKGIDVVIELGTGKVLSGLMRRFNNEIKCFQVGDPISLQKTVKAIRNL